MTVVDYSHRWNESEFYFRRIKHQSLAVLTCPSLFWISGHPIIARADTDRWWLLPTLALGFLTRFSPPDIQHRRISSASCYLAHDQGLTGATRVGKRVSRRRNGTVLRTL